MKGQCRIVLIYHNFIFLPSKFDFTIFMISALQIAAITWNVGQEIPPNIFPALMEAIPEGTDVVTIALEEISTHEGIVNSKAVDAMNSWTSTLENGLGKNYSRVFGENLGSVATYIFFNKSTKYDLKIVGQILLSLRDDVVTDSKSSLAGVISVSNGKDTKRITIIGNHLQCYDEEYPRRNKEWKYILREQIETDYIVLMGDLNYRIQLPRDKVIELINEHNIQEILKHDQLKLAQKENQQFAKFEEAEITFMPTYKFDENTDNYDTSSKQRVPSYTDRILVSTETNSPKPHIKQYQSLKNFRSSDHRPVYALIEFVI